MSELSAAAAAALGIPEAIVNRSAAARATETGMSVDEVLTAWAGGATVAAPEGSAPSPAEEPASAAPEPDAASEVVVTPASPAPGETVAAAASQPAAAAPVSTVSGRPPVLVGKTDNPISVFVGVVGLFVAVFLVGLVGPAVPIENPGARTSELPYTATAETGREVYLSVGCASCHTQLVRPIVADVGLGGVTLNDSNQVLGTRRFGPDLSDVGSRLSGSQIEATITGLGSHPALSLSQSDLEVLVAYLVESQTSTAGPAPAPEGETTDTTLAAPEGEG
jgi:hypothetical protein